MPLLDPPKAVEAAVSRWKSTLQKTIAYRIDASRLRPVFLDLSKQCPIPASSLVDVLLTLQAAGATADDPLVFCFFAELLDLDLITTAPVLLSTLQQPELTRLDERSVQHQYGSDSMPGFVERIFQILAADYTSKKANNASATSQHMGSNAFALSRWLKTTSDHEATQSLESNGLRSLDQSRIGMYDALAMLVTCVFSDPSFREVQKQAWWKEKRVMVRNSLESFLLQVGQWIQSANSANLQTLLSMQPFLELDKKGLPKLSDDQVRNSVTDLPLVSSRAGTYIWINACLFARPLTDDMTLMQLLHARGADNIQASAVDLLVASFEILTNALLIKESDQSVDLIKSFICNRLPPLLASVSNLLLPLTSEQCIQMGFSNINIDPLPPLTDGADVIREQLQVTRSEFLQACILHALVSDTTVAVILQRPSTALPKAQKLNKDMLVQQCAHNTGKVEGLIESLKAMQGNAGAIAGCIVDIVNNCCNLKDTMSLKAVCMSLIKHIPSIDVIFQYNQPMHLILPMCSLLNDWVHEQDQSELQPPYEEFAVIFLLVLVVINRYNLRKEDIGILDNENFILTMMRDQSTSSALESMPDVQKERLAKWIEGLYATDEQDETSGINDEVMSQCPPQAFYQLVPTLFEQSVIARKSNAVPVATLLGGLELLLEPFLLPSLIGGLSWMIKHSWEDHGDADILLAMLNKLLKPSSPSSDTQAMHKAILGIIATPLAQSLETLKRKSFKKDVNGLLEILRPHLNQQRSTQASSTEVQQWAVAFEEDYAKAISTNVRHVVKWITAVGPNPPPSFSFRLYVTLIELIGPEAVLDAMLDEIAQLTVAGKGAEALDVCAAIVCAPSPDRATGSALQRVLHLRSLDTEGLLDAPASRSEATLRLQRRVDAHHTAMLTASTSMTMPMQDQAADQMMQDLGLTGDDSGVGNASASQSGVQAGDEGLNFDGTDISSQLNQPMDGINNANNDATGLEATGSAGQVDQMQDIFGDLGVDLGNSGGDQGIDAFNPQGDGGMGQQSQEDDIFAGLDMDLADFTDDYNFG